MGHHKQSIREFTTASACKEDEPAIQVVVKGPVDGHT